MKTLQLSKLFLGVSLIFVLCSPRVYATTDSIRINNRAVEIWDLKYSKPDSFLIYSKELIEDSKKHNFKTGISLGIGYIGIYYLIQNQVDSSIFYFQESIKILEQLDDKQRIARAYNYMGYALDAIEDYENALKYYIESLKLKEELKDKLGIANSLNNIGVVYLNTKQNLKALEYFEQALTVYIDVKDSSGINIAYNNIGKVYHELNILDKAIDYYLKSLEIEELLGNNFQGLAQSYNSIGSFYANQNQHDIAMYYYQKSIACYDSIDIEYSSNTLTNIARSLLMLNKKEDALGNALKANSLALKTKSTDNLITSYKVLSEIYEGLNKPKLALTNLQMHIQLKDSIYKLNREKELTRIEHNFKQSESYRQLQKQLKKEEKDKSENTAYTFMLVITFLILMFWFVAKSRIKNASIKKSILNATGVSLLLSFLWTVELYANFIVYENLAFKIFIQALGVWLIIRLYHLNITQINSSSENNSFSLDEVKDKIDFE